MPLAKFRIYQSVTLRDVDGQSATTGYHTELSAADATATNMEAGSDSFNTVLAATTNAKVVQRSAHIRFDEAQGVGTDGEFPLVSQKALLHFSNAQGSRSSLSIPAPLEAIFRSPPSDDIVDPANAAVAAVIAFIVANASDVGSNLYNLFQGGALASHRRSRRRSIHS